MAKQQLTPQQQKLVDAASEGHVQILTSLQQLSTIRKALVRSIDVQPMCDEEDACTDTGDDMRRVLIDMIDMTLKDPGTRDTLHGFVL